MNTNPIYVVDDDTDDGDILREVLDELGLKNEVKFFFTGEGLLQELETNTVVPFLIISDVNLPKMDGFELRRRILEDTKISEKTIPFIFWSTSASESQIKRAYDLSAHGFFIKGRNYNDFKESISEIVRYWNMSLAPH